MEARGSAISCPARAGFSAAARLSASPMRWRISLAAALVKVTTSMRSTGQPSQMSRTMRSTSTAVLPDPAAAQTMRLWPRSVMASCCSLVQFGMGIPPP